MAQDLCRTPSKRQGLRAVAWPGSESGTQRLPLPSASSKQCHRALILQAAPAKPSPETPSHWEVFIIRSRATRYRVNSRATMPGHGCAPLPGRKAFQCVCVCVCVFLLCCTQPGPQKRWLEAAFRPRSS